MPLEISSRSESVSANLERCRGEGRIPPLGANMPKIEPEGLSNTRPIDFSDSPRCQRSQISAFCSAVYLIRVLYDIFYTPSFYLMIECCVDRLRPPPRLCKNAVT